MDQLRGLRAQEQAGNTLPSGVGRAHEAPENHRDDIAPAVTGLDPEGEAAAAGVQLGDRLLDVNGEPVKDVLEFTFLTSGEPAELTFDREGTPYTVFLEGLAPSGIEFERELFDGLQRCNNSCVFCFVHQLPAKVVRRSLLTKDEDYRLSFLHGGYVTMGNFTDEDYARILDMKLSPLYVSVHATDPEVRKEMLGNPQAPDILEGLHRLKEGGVDFHGQIVLVPGYNTGEILRRSLKDLASFENMRATAVVPVGLTDFRDRLPNLRELTPEECREAIEAIEEARQQDPQGTRIFAADELFAGAQLPIPPAEYYDPEFQLREDGVGMVRSFEDEFADLASKPWPETKVPEGSKQARVAIVTGVAAGKHFDRFLLPRLKEQPGLDPEIVVVKNDFFGHGIVVAGLLTGQDILRAVKSRGDFDRVLIGEHAFQPGGDIMLDGSELKDLEKALGTDVRRVADDARSLIEHTLGVPLASCGSSAQALEV